MRGIIRTENTIPEKLDCQETRDALKEIALTGNRKLIRSAIYRDSYDTPDGRGSKVIDALNLSYDNKCAYCERICKADVEHYRPKKKVRESINHPGYYWLCYEWTNLIPSCINCNREGAKHDQFPVLANYVIAPTIDQNGEIDLRTQIFSNSPLSDELPELIHPEEPNFDPFAFFDFEVDENLLGIRMRGIDDALRGDSTIKICLLNRQELRVDRKNQVILDFKTSIDGFFFQRDEGLIDDVVLVDRMLDAIRALSQKAIRQDFTFTFLRQYILRSIENFEKVVIPFFEPQKHKLILEAASNII